MMEKVQRFGGAMFTPVLLFSFSGIMVALCIIFKNPMLVGASPLKLGTTFGRSLKTVRGRSSTKWNYYLSLDYRSVSQKANARAAMEAFVVYITCNYFISGMIEYFGSFFGVNFAADPGGESGLKMIAGIKTLDTGIIGAIFISAIVVYLHNKFFDTKLPDFLGIFQGSSFVVILGFF